MVSPMGKSLASAFSANMPRNEPSQQGEEPSVPIELTTLALAAARPQVELAKSLNEAKRANLRTVFLSHSHKDATYAEGVATLLLEAGFEAYIDWQDTSMPASPNHQTASVIKRKIESADLFIFLATPASTDSRWCPWEIGYADGVKDIDHIIIAQTKDALGRNYGNEYLSLYRSLDVSADGRLGVWKAGSTEGGVPANSL
jgi:TIR domain